MDGLRCEAIITMMLARRERELGLTWLRELFELCPVGGMTTAAAPVGLAQALCAVDPRIEFDGRGFVVTGESLRADRANIEDRIARRGGITRRAISSQTDFLIVCDAGSPHWAFAATARKLNKLTPSAAKAMRS